MASSVNAAGQFELEEVADVFKALSHPMRLDIMRRMVAVPELACTTLEHDLPITKPTISYHIKILRQVGLVRVRKVGKYYHYTSRIDEMDDVLPGLRELLRDRLS